jgi:carbon monoxide dehydrogenase subunit G
MELTNEFIVGIPPEQAWEVLTDIERIAPCLPGARLTEVVGDEFHGVVKVKVGPISTEYRGMATFIEQDAGARRAVLRAEGREARGQGTARATVTATLAPAGEATTVRVVTDLAVSGRVAQFGRGVLADVSSRLLAQFAEALEATVSADGADDGDRPIPGASVDPTTAGGGPDTDASVQDTGDTPPERRSAPAPAPPPAPAPSVDLLATVGPAIAKRLLPLLAAAGVLWVAWRRRRR